MAGDNVPIKGIEYEIKGNADAAAKSIDRLRDSYSKAAKTFKGGLGLGKAAQEVEDFGTQAKESERSFEAVASGMNSAEKAATSLAQKIMSMKSVWTDLGANGKEALEKIELASNKVKDKMQSVTLPLRKQFAALGAAATISFNAVAARVSDSFGRAFKNFAGSYAGASILQPFILLGQKISSIASKTREAFLGLKDKLRDAFSGDSLTAITQKIEKAQQKVSAFGSAILQQKSAWTALSGEADKFLEPLKSVGATVLQPIVGAMKAFGQTTVDVRSSFTQTMAKMTAAGHPLLGVLGGIGTSLLSIVKNAGKVALSIGKVLVGAFSKLVGVVKNVLKSIAQIPGKIKDSITNAVENLKEKIADVGAKAKEWFNNSIFTKPLRDAAAGAGEFAKKLANVGNSLKRILFYRVIRTVIKEIGDAFKTGINNLYAWSAAIGGEFAASMDRMATSMQYFKNSIGAAVAPLINALAPALDFVIDKVVSLLNVINQLFARLTGASYWTRAIKQAASYGDAASSAGGAAKEAMKYLAPFDELNVLPSDSGRGGGGGAGGAAGGGMFEEMVSFNEEIKDFADKIREAFNAGDWEGVGDVISKKLNDIIENRIPWASLGQKFGYWVNAIVSTEYWTLEKTHFDSLGKGIADFINNTLEQIDFNVWGRLITRKLTAALDFAIGLFVNLDTTTIGKSIHDFFIGMFDEWSEWFDKWDWGDLAHIAYNKLKGLFDGLSFGEIASSALTALGKAFGSAAKFLGTFFGDLGKDIKDWFDANLKGQTWSETGRNILNWIGQGFTGIATWVDTNFVTPFANAFIGEEKWSKVKSVGKTVLNNIKVGFKDLTKWVDQNIVDPIRDGLNADNAWEGIKSAGSAIKGNLKSGLGDLAAWAVDNIINPIGQALSGGYWQRTDVGGEFKNVWVSSWKDIDSSSIKNLLDNMLNFDIKGWVQDNIIDPVVKKLKEYDWDSLFAWIGEKLKYAFDVAVFGKEKADKYAQAREAASSGYHATQDQINEGEAIQIGPNGGYYIPATVYMTNAVDEIPEDQKVVKNSTSNVTSITDAISDAKKKIDKFKALVEKAEDGIDPKKKILEGIKGIFGSAVQDENTVVETITGAKATIRRASPNKNTVVDEVSTVGSIGSAHESGKFIMPSLRSLGEVIRADPAKTLARPSIDSIAKLAAANKDEFTGQKNKEARTIAVWARYAAVNKESFVGNNNKEARTIAVWAKYGAAIKDAFTGQNNKDARTIGVWAKYAATQLGLSNDQRTINTWANYAAAKLGLTDAQRTIDSTAKFVKQNDEVLSKKNASYWLSRGADLTTQYDTASKKNYWVSRGADLVKQNDSIKDKTITGMMAQLKTWDYISNWFTKKFNQLPMTAKLTSIDKSAVTGSVVSVVGKMTNVTKALGGVYAGGHWSPIQAYASGGSPFGGQLFLAREAGPELVGTLKGHTAVMNNDQIVASVSAGVARAISNIRFHMDGFPMASVPTYDQGEDTEEMMYRAFMRAIADSDFTFEDDINIEMDGETAYQGVVRRNRQATRRTGVNPLMA